MIPTTEPTADQTTAPADSTPERLPAEEIERLTAMHTEAIALNRVTIHTNFQQAIQDAILDPKQRKDLSKLAASFHQWAEGEALLNRN